MTLLGGVFLALAALYRCDAQTLFGVSTLVGGGSPGGTLAGHLDGVGTVALLNNPSFIAIAAGGEFALFTQTGNHLVRKISIWTKNVTTLAGNAGTNGYADGFGTSSRFNAPWGVAMGPQNSFAVIADSSNYLVRLLELPSIAVTTLAGTAGVVGIANGVGTAASFNQPCGVAVNSAGSLAYVSENGGHDLRSIDLSSRAVSTVAGLGGACGSTDGTGTAARFCFPAGISLSSSDTSLLVADYGNRAIRRISLSTATVATLTGSTLGCTDGVGTLAAMGAPVGVALYGSGATAIVSDWGTATIRLVTLSTASVMTIAGACGVSSRSDGIGTSAYFNYANGIAVDPAMTYALIADKNNNVIRQIVLASATNSASQSSTFSTSSTPSLTFTSTQTGTASGTISTTQSSSPTITSSGSITQSPSLSRTPTQVMTPTMTQSATPSPTESPTSTLTPSLTLTSSPTRTSSATGTASETGTPSVTQSRTPSLTETLTGSQSSSEMSTPSSTATPTGSRTPSASATPSQLQTVSTTETPSSSSTSSSTVTPSLTNGASATQTPSGRETASETSTRSQSGSETPSPAITSAASMSWSPSSSISEESASPSGTLTWTQSLTHTPSASPTARQETNSSQLPTPSTMSTILSTSPRPDPSSIMTTQVTSTGTQDATLSAGASRLGTTSPSSPPYALVPSPPATLDATSGTYVDGALQLSDSLPPVSLQFVLSRCPADTAERSVALSCEAFLRGLAPLATSGGSLPATTLPSSSASLACLANLHDSVLPMSLYLLPSFRSLAAAGSVRCELNSSVSAVPMGTVAVNVSISPTFWPTFDDAIVVASNGFSRSVGGLRVVNATDALLPAAAALSVHGNLSRAIGNSDVVLSAIQDTWGSIASLGSAPVFALTLTSRTPVVLRSANRSFSLNTTVSVSGVDCQTSTSSDGRWLSFVSPSPVDACGGTSVDCLATIVVSNPPSAGLRGAGLACPPFCSSTMSPDSGVVPLTQASHYADPVVRAANVVTARRLPSGLVQPLTAADYASVTDGKDDAGAVALIYPAGLYYAEACSASGVYTDPASGACTNISSPLYPLCAFGGGSSCQPCPTNAQCPGGSRCWPLPGFWVAVESIPSVHPCALPDAVSKCTGWSTALAQTKCGPGYLQGSYLCGACAFGYFLADNGACSRCPAVASVWDRYGTLIILLSSAIGITFLVFMLMTALITLSGGNVKGLVGVRNFFLALGWVLRLFFYRSVTRLLVHILTVLQVFSSVSQVNSSRLTPQITAAYRIAGLLQLQGIAIPVACTGGYYFSPEVSLMAVGISAWTITLCLSLARWTCKSRSRATTVAAHASITLATYLHPPVSLTALRLISCQSVQLTTAALQALDSGGGATGGTVLTGSSSDHSVSSINLLLTNPFVVCYSGSHLSAGIFAVVTLFTYVLGLPFFTLLLLWRDPQRHRNASGDGATGPILAPFLADSGYTQLAWFWRHIDMAVVLGLNALAAVLPLPATMVQLAMKLAFTFALLGVLLVCLVALPNPYAQPWRWYLRVALVILSASCVLLNGATRSLDLGYGGEALESFVAPASYINVAVLLLTVVVLFIGYGLHLHRNAMQLKVTAVESHDYMESSPANLVVISTYPRCWQWLFCPVGDSRRSHRIQAASSSRVGMPIKSLDAESSVACGAGNEVLQVPPLLPTNLLHSEVLSQSLAGPSRTEVPPLPLADLFRQQAAQGAGFQYETPLALNGDSDANVEQADERNPALSSDVAAAIVNNDTRALPAFRHHAAASVSRTSRAMMGRRHSLATTGIACGGPLRSVREGDSGGHAPARIFDDPYPGSVWPHTTGLPGSEGRQIAANVRPLPNGRVRVEGWLANTGQPEARTSFVSSTPVSQSHVAPQSPLRGLQARVPRRSLAAPPETTLPMHVHYERYRRRNSWAPALSASASHHSPGSPRNQPAGVVQTLAAYATPAPAAAVHHRRVLPVPHMAPVESIAISTEPFGSEPQFRRPLGRRLSAAGLHVTGSTLSQYRR